MAATPAAGYAAPRPGPADTLDLDPVTGTVPCAVAHLDFMVNIRQDPELCVAAAY